MLWWVYWMAERGRSVAQIEKCMAVLAFMFKLNGWEDLTKSFFIWQAIKGLKKGCNRQDSQRPVSVELLGSFSLYEETLFRATFVLAFFRAFRVGELVSHSKRVPRWHQWGEVELSLDRVDIWLRRSKTDQVGVAKIRKSSGSHSFRIGAATEAARLGLSEAVVKRIGRWESRRFKNYVRPTLV
ncbi:hypothetical protein XELAEV_18009446mg [Xenopus laevis]|uniref:Tyr recombinase domain-containing protein n=1 Tax=Xenopus laevis TaxID=8355 RepID=A0A974I0F4_XENLA|nr:hypothetical protein XELAEV_18009446mg [Xenopus laevis]